ncbi:tyrosine-type recombinase/integrase [Rhodoferax sediminis]|uniref:tyrosine-type recombinase/integrase n=1 Tax=Rhodoferax sediminis TaxID=2509614 RepID=UPI001FCE67FD|nr:tyrosine-type recombinase/integrase [Rhodoferax sediminis]
MLEEQRGKNPKYCFTFRGERIQRAITNTAWYSALEAAGIGNFRFHDLRHTWASWHRQAGTSCG